MAKPYYAPSGRFSPVVLPWLIAFGGAGAILAAPLYAVAILYIPFIVVNVVAVLGFGALLGWLAGQAIARGHTRNPALAALMGAGLGLFAIYTMWLAWVGILLGREGTDLSVIDLVLSPELFASVIGIINKNGTWSLKDAQVSGGMLSFVWVCEAAIVLLVPAHMAWSRASEPFCESCQSWCPKIGALATVPATTLNQVKAQLENLDLKGLGGERRPAGQEPAVVLEAHSCGCGRTATLSATHVYFAQEKGKTVRKTQAWVNYRLVDPEQLAAVRAIGERAAGEGAPVGG